MACGLRLICAPGDLAEAGPGVRFAIEERDGAAPGFVIRYGGEVFAFVNRCPHLGTQLDWQEGEFFDVGGLYLVCSTHGALFEPRSGSCVAGPCVGAALERLAIVETPEGVFLAGKPPP